MKFSPRPGGPPRRTDSRAVLVVLAVLGLQAVILYLIVAVAFPDWRPAFLVGEPDQPAIPSRLALPPATQSTEGTQVAPTDAAASRMLFGGPGSAVLGDRVPTAPTPSVSTSAPGRSMASSPYEPHATLPRAQEPPSPAAQMAFQRYLEWLRTAELERQSLRSWGQHHLPSDAAASESDPAQRREILRQAGEEVSAFRQRVLRTKPIVPADCRVVDQYYMAALAQEGAEAAALLDALEQQDRDRIRQLQRRGTAGIDRDLTVANSKLEQTFRKRGEPVTLRLEMGPDASLLGALTE